MDKNEAAKLSQYFHQKLQSTLRHLLLIFADLGAPPLPRLTPNAGTAAYGLLLPCILLQADRDEEVIEWMLPLLLAGGPNIGVNDRIAVRCTSYKPAVALRPNVVQR